jgi:hypothetical protein
MTEKAKQEKTKMTLRYTDDEIELVGLPTHPNLSMIVTFDDENENDFFVDVREQGDDCDASICATNYLWFDSVEAKGTNSGQNFQLSIGKPGKLISYFFFVDKNRHFNLGRKSVEDFNLHTFKFEDEIIL